MPCFTPNQYKRVRAALQSAFPGRTSLEVMLRQVAGTPKLAPYPDLDITKGLMNLNLISSENDSMQTTYSKVLADIEAYGLCLELVTTARAFNPFEAEFAKLEVELGGLPAVLPEDQLSLEKLLFRTLEDMADPVEWGARYGPIMYRVCRVETDLGLIRKGFGTGFLVGPDLLMTNFHVAADFLPVPAGEPAQKYEPQTILFSFDRRIVNGKELQGTDYRLKDAQDPDKWLVASSPTHPQDGVDPVGQPERADALDYALLRLDGMAAEEKLTAADGAKTLVPEKRGFLTLSTSGAEAMKEQQSLVTFQHPNGDSLKLDIGAISGKTETRVTYTTSTLGGSSGSPCFDLGWRMVALHHAFLKGKQLNQGIPASAIVEDLYKKDKLDGVAVE